MDIKKRVTACILAALLVCSASGITPATTSGSFGGIVVSAKGDDPASPASNSKSPTASIDISETNFPDEGFRSLVSKFDTDGDGILSGSEIEQVTELNINNCPHGMPLYSSLKGLEYFTALKKLELSSFNDDEFDYSSVQLESLTSLEDLSVIYSPRLIPADLSALPSVKSLAVSIEGESFTEDTIAGASQLQSLALVSCSDLKTIDLSGLSITGFSVEGSNSVESVVIPSSINDLTLSDIDALKSFKEDESRDIGGVISGYDDATLLRSLTISGCPVEEFDMTGLRCPAEINLDACITKTINLKDQSALKRLSINGAYTDYQNPENSLKLDISGTALEGLRLTYAYPLGNPFDVSTDNAMITGMTALKSLRSLTVYGCNTYDYDLTGCTKLKDLNIAGETDDYGYNSGDTFHSLDLTGCTSLRKLKAKGYAYEDSTITADDTSFASLEELDLENINDLSVFGSMSSLKKLSLESSNITSLDLSAAQGLTSLSLSSCSSLTSLSFSKANIEEIDLSYVNLDSMDLSGSSNLRSVKANYTYVTDLDLRNCTALEDVEFCDTRFGDAGEVPITLNVSGCTALKNLTCENQLMLTAVDLGSTSYNSLESVVLSGCGIESINLLGKPSLRSVDLTGCRVTELALTGCSALRSLYLKGCPVTRLVGFQSCTDLEELDVSGCQLTSLDLSGCNNLHWVDCSGGALTSLKGGHFVSYKGIPKKNYFGGGGLVLTTRSVSYSGGYDDYDLQDCPGYLDCSHNAITSISGLSFDTYTSVDRYYDDTNDEWVTNEEVIGGILDCSYNNLTSLDVGSISTLYDLDCSHNSLRKLDFEPKTEAEAENLKNLKYLKYEKQVIKVNAPINCRYPAATLGLTEADWTAVHQNIRGYHYYTGWASGYSSILIPDGFDTAEGIFSPNAGRFTYYYFTGKEQYKEEESGGGGVMMSAAAETYTTSSSAKAPLTDIESDYDEGEDIYMDVTVIYIPEGEENEDPYTEEYFTRCELLNHNLTDGSPVCSDCGKIVLSEEYFPDNAFRSYLYRFADESGAIYASDITDLDFSGSNYCGIKDLAGIQYFTELEYLNLGSEPIEGVVDVSGLTELTTIICSRSSDQPGSITGINAAGCTSLETLRCDHNAITSLTLTDCTALAELSCGYNYGLTSFDITPCTSLEYLDASYSGLTQLAPNAASMLVTLDVSGTGINSLDLTNYTALRSLKCNNSISLSQLKVTGCSSLTALDCSSCSDSLSALDLTGCSSLKTLNCSNNGFIVFGQGGLLLDHDSNPELLTLDCSYCNFGSIYIFGYEKLESIDCSCNPDLTSLDVRTCDALKALNCRGNGNGAGLSDLKIQRCYALERLECYNNSLTSLDLSGGTLFDPIASLKVLNCASNLITDLNLTGCDSLEELTISLNKLESIEGHGISTGIKKLKCIGNNFTSLDLSAYTELTELACGSNNNLVSVDASACTKLSSLSCSFCNNLETLKVKNGTDNNYALTSVDCSYDPKLKAIDLNNCRNLTSVNLSNTNNLESIDLRNTRITKLTYNSTTLTALDLTGCSSLTELLINDCGLTGSLDFSGCTSLKKLDCSNNQIESLTFWNNLNCPLYWLNCSHNKLTALNLNKIKKINYLDCSYNKISELVFYDTGSVSDATALETLICNDNCLTVLRRGNSTYKCYNNVNNVGNQTVELESMPCRFSVKGLNAYAPEESDDKWLCDVVGADVEYDFSTNTTTFIPLGDEFSYTYKSDYLSSTNPNPEFSVTVRTATAGAHSHPGLEFIAAKPATVEAEGNIAYWHCTTCGEYFSDEELTNWIDLEDTVIPKLRQFTVKFETYGGTEIDDQLVIEGESVSRPENDPEKDGYDFLGWFVGDKEYNFGDPVTEGFTINAKFAKMLTYENISCDTLSFDYNGSEKKVNVYVTEGDKILLEGTDYTVEGNKGTAAGRYLLTVTGTGEYYGSTQFVWNILEKKSCVVSYDLRDGNGVRSNEVPLKTITYVEAPNVVGKTFKCWADENDVPVSYLQCYSFVAIEDVNLYAVYTEDAFEKEPILSLKGAASSVNGNNAICYTFTYSVPNDAEVKSSGILYATNKMLGADTSVAGYANVNMFETQPETVTSELSLGGTKAKNKEAGFDKNNGTMQLSVVVRTQVEAYFYAVGYVVYEKDGDTFKKYTPVYVANYNGVR